ncbi:carboxymuconolactone decarboxylase family protein [Mycobacterium yunnanensis]|uniref:Carboxymuconolactone decarboxylase family protein n=1 Tax=Mycobacterium yunnanensis TaxID=368477 RepID=A0A9X2YYT2_9MYCO|nr:carboxymuconolactone decarboxylase family protein [Mycobacterium yunnanensis]MCV7420584.1 carboxymuconolactone decarboxylase family protein [Mycobacterium yunnanensis]
MTRIPLVDPATLTGRRKAQFDRFPSNLTRALLLLDDSLAGQLPETANALRASPLDPAWREGVILRVAARQRSAYERFQHLSQARQHGWTTAQVDAIEDERISDDVLPQDFITVLRFVDEIIDGSTVSDSTFTAVHHVLDDRDLLTVVVLVGHYMGVARVLGVLQVPLDGEPDPWTTEH